MSARAVLPKFLSVEIPESSAIDFPIDLLRPCSVKLEKMIASAVTLETSGVIPSVIKGSIAGQPIPVIWFPANPQRNEWLGIDTKKAYEESVRCMKEVINAATDNVALLKFRISQIEGKLIPPHFTIALSYLKIRRLI